jgi:hypothetical protein
MIADIKCPKCGYGQATDLNQLTELFGEENDIGKQWMCDSCSHFFDAVREAWYEREDLTELTLSQLADITINDWGDEMSPAAYPYIKAMFNLKDMNDAIGFDSAQSIVMYFLLNAKSWNSKPAKKIKAELRRRVKACQN